MEPIASAPILSTAQPSGNQMMLEERIAYLRMHYVEKVKDGLNQTLFIHFVDSVVDSAAFPAREPEKAAQELIRLLITFYHEGGLNIRALRLGIQEYLGLMKDLFIAIADLNNGRIPEMGEFLELLYLATATHPNNQCALLAHLGKYLTVDAYWEEPFYHWLYQKFINYPEPRENFLKGFNDILKAMSSLFFPHLLTHRTGYVWSHLIRDPGTPSSVLHSLLSVALSDLPKNRVPVTDDIGTYIQVIFRSQAFRNFRVEDALAFAKQLANYFIFDADLTYEMYDALLHCATKETRTVRKVLANQVTILEETTYISTTEIAELFSVFLVNMTWNRAKFIENNKDKLMLLFKRGVRIDDRQCIRELTDEPDKVSPLFFRKVTAVSERFCQEFALDIRVAMVHMNCHLFAGICNLISSHLRSTVRPNYLPAPHVVNKDLFSKKVSLLGLHTCMLLFSKIQQADPQVVKDHNLRIQQKLQLLNGLKINWAGRLSVIKASPSGIIPLAVEDELEEEDNPPKLIEEYRQLPHSESRKKT